MPLICFSSSSFQKNIRISRETNYPIDELDFEQVLNLALTPFISFHKLHQDIVDNVSFKLHHVLRFVFTHILKFFTYIHQI